MKNYKKFLLALLVIIFFLACISVEVQAISTSKSSPSSSTAKSSSSGFKSGSFSSSGSKSNSTSSKASTSTNKSGTSSTPSKSTTTTKKTVDTSSSALRRIPPTYSSHSVSNNYYYNVDNGGSSFWSNYWLYRAMTPEHRTYVVTDGSTTVAPAYTGARSILADVTTLIVVISLIVLTVYFIKRRNKRL